MTFTGRLILVPTANRLSSIISFYQKRSEFLVIAYNGDNFTAPADCPVPVVSYGGIGREIALSFGFGDKTAAHPMGTNWRAWAKAADTFPQIDFWIIHDYDVICKPTDQEIREEILHGHYGMIGLPFPRYKPGIDSDKWNNKTFPFSHCPYEQIWHSSDAIIQRTDRHLFGVLEKTLPYVQDGVPTILGGYGDFIAAPHAFFKALQDPCLNDLKVGGIEQVIHGVAHKEGFKPVDVSKRFQSRIKFYAISWFSESDQIIHSVKDFNLVLSVRKRYAAASKSLIKNAVRWIKALVARA